MAVKTGKAMPAHQISLRAFLSDYGFSSLEEAIEEMGYEWADGICPALCDEGCEVEPDGHCPHGCPSILLAMGLI